jgi:uncharacterized protein YbjT (DUF2867 family)
MILVIGATGTIGSQLVPQLLQSGHPVRILTRRPEKAAKFGGEVEIVIGNLDDEESLIPALRGVSRFFLITSRTQQDRNALSAAKRAGAAHVVKISTQEAGWSPVEGHGHWHKEREDVIQKSGLAWTFLRPTMYMSFVGSWAPSIRAENTIYAGGGDGRLAPIDPWDVAAVAKAALTGPGHENAAYELTGPELLSFGEMAAVLSQATGRPIRRVGISDSQQGEVFTKMGLPKYTVEGLVETFSLVRGGRFAYLTPDVEKVTGTRPRTLETWASENVAVFR